MELNYDNLNDAREFIKNELKCFESYLKYLKDQDESNYIRNVIKSYNVSIRVLEERLMCEIMCGEVD